MSFILLGILNSQAAGGSFTYWLSLLDNGSTFTSFTDVTVDSQGNPAVTGRSGNGDSILAVKYDQGGAVIWQKKLDDAQFNQGFGIGADSSENTYIAGSAYNNKAALVKHNSAGVVQWQRGYGTFDQAYGMSTTAGGNSYLADYNFNDYGHLVKYNSSGTLQWQRFMYQYRDPSVAVSESNENVYFAGSTGSPNTSYSHLSKYNSSGTLQWQRQMSRAGYFGAKAVVVDSNENIYVGGRYDGNRCYIVKYNSSGTVQWTRGTYFDNVHLAVDSNDNVYVVGRKPGAPGSGLGIAKYNSSGTLQWDRVIYTTESVSDSQGIYLDSNDDMVIATVTYAAAGGPAGFLAKLPSDGSLTGTYDLNGYTFTYSAAGMITETPSFSATTGSQSNGTSSSTETATSMASATTTLTEYIVGVG